MEKVYHAVGKRKSAVARVYLTPGKGVVQINDRELDEYFRRTTARMIINQPLELTSLLDRFNITVNVFGGGTSAQAQAVKHGISKCLLEFDPALRPALKRVGFLTRDAREVERKKYGRSGARKRFQFSKR